MSEQKHTPGSIAALAEEARRMPWEHSTTDVPFSARYAFQQAITADHYLELLEALAELAEAATRLEHAYIRQWGENGYTTAAHNAGAKARAALSKATGQS